MLYRDLGRLGLVSSLTLGGGGIGQVWGKTTRDEAVATVKEAVACGITLLDLAPSYGNGESEEVVGQAFGGNIPEGVRISTKCRVDNPDPSEVYNTIEASLSDSLNRLRLDRVDFLLLHNQIIPDQEIDRYPGTSLSLFRTAVVPAFETLIDKGSIKGWGITGIGVPPAVKEALQFTPGPSVVQIISNLLDSPGSLKRFDGDPMPRQLIEEANNSGVSVMGIRAVQAGALTDNFDRDISGEHPDMNDYNRAKRFRRVADSMGTSPAILAHRYALSMHGISTVVLGVKNREELVDCITAEEQGVLEADIIEMIDNSVAI
ncbi:MAG: aldo/keto reductase [SAR202 cluster bacterium]|nr:aldo/keto reductase [SAR202 cluster bacterium]|tara:strand:+ start:2416 stop:3369 length:954 start_codon:yes stop_codon:yes gene_type:complete